MPWSNAIYGFTQGYGLWRVLNEPIDRALEASRSLIAERSQASPGRDRYRPSRATLTEGPETGPPCPSAGAVQVHRGLTLSSNSPGPLTVIEIIEGNSRVTQQAFLS